MSDAPEDVLTLQAKLFLIESVVETLTGNGVSDATANKIALLVVRKFDSKVAVFLSASMLQNQLAIVREALTSQGPEPKVNGG